MVIRALYLIAGALALTAATIYFFTGGRGEDVTVRVMLLGIGGVVLLALGLSGSRRGDD